MLVCIILLLNFNFESLYIGLPSLRIVEQKNDSYANSFDPYSLCMQNNSFAIVNQLANLY